MGGDDGSMRESQQIKLGETEDEDRPRGNGPGKTAAPVIEP